MPLLSELGSVQGRWHRLPDMLPVDTGLGNVQWVLLARPVGFEAVSITLAG